MHLITALERYIPSCEQEETDKKLMLAFIRNHPDCLLRDNLIAHFTASAWTVNRDRTKVLMVYHNIYDSWSWVGGNADGEENLAAVALRELQEETGVVHASLVSPEIFSIETLTVNGHEKRGAYVPCHLHLNVTYLAEADENDPLFAKIDENSGVRWCTIAESLKLPTEEWMVERVYKKLNQKLLCS